VFYGGFAVHGTCGSVLNRPRHTRIAISN